MSSFLQIGPVRWELDVDVLCTDPVYSGFMSPQVRPLVTVPVSVRSERKELPPGEPLYCGGKNWALWEEGRDLIVCSGFTGQAVPRFHCRIDRDSGAVHLSIDPSREDGASPLRYPIDQILSWGILARCGGLILHSAVAVKDGVGWVFSGRSGAGKSTLSELCHQAGWRILNDDRVMVFKRGSEWRVAGTPWHGSGRFSEAAEVPLGGLFFIEKSDADRVEPMREDAVRYRLLDVASVPWFEEEWSQTALDVADRFSRQARFFRLSFTRSTSAVQALESCLAQQAEMPA